MSGRCRRFGRAPSRKARERAHPRLFRSMLKDKPALCLRVKMAHPPAPNYRCAFSRADVAHPPMFVAACTLLFSSLPTLAHPANSPQDQGTTQTQSVQKGENQKVQTGPGKEG